MLHASLMYASPLNFLESLLVKSCDAAVDKFTVLEFSAHPKPVTIFFGSIPQLVCYPGNAYCLDNSPLMPLDSKLSPQTLLPCCNFSAV